jgi:hypothetical protein
MISCTRLDTHQRGVQLGERLEPTRHAGTRQVFGEPLADLESRPSVGLVVELDPEPRLERLDALLQPATDVHDALEQFAVGDVGELDVDVNAKAGVGCRDLRPPLKAAGAYVEFNLVARQ